jgi:hypothetical protein
LPTKHPKQNIIQKTNWQFLGSSIPNLRIHTCCNNPPKHQAWSEWCSSFATKPFCFSPARGKQLGQQVSFIVMSVDNTQSLPLIPGSTFPHKVASNALVLSLEDCPHECTRDPHRDANHSELALKSWQMFVTLLHCHEFQIK